MTKKACGQVLARDGGVDLACVRDGRTHTLRLRFCLDARRRVRLLGTGVFYGQLTRVEVFNAIKVTPARHRDLVTKCVRAAMPMLAERLRAYVAGFDVALRPVLRLPRGLLGYKFTGCILACAPSSFVQKK